MSTEPTNPILVRTERRKGVFERRWFSSWYDDQGKRRGKTFGWESDTTARQARQRWESWKIKSAARRYLRNPGGESAAYTITSLAAQYLRHAGRTYLKDGKRTSHVVNVKYAMRALRDGLGTKPADSAEAPQIAALRDGLLLWSTTRGEDGGEERKARALKTVNTRLRIVKDAFVWARERGKISKETLADVLSVKRLRKGRSAATPAKKILSVSDELIALTVEQAPQVLRDMIELVRLTGMRPGEACSMRGSEIEAGGEIWFYRPRHKLEHLEGDHERIICLGPRAQKLIGPYLKRKIGAYLFSPAEAHAERLKKKRESRNLKKWPMYPSHAKRLKKNPTARLGHCYTHSSFRKAVHWACRKAGIETWNPNQLRHAAATRLEKKYGRDGSRVVLGHTSEKTTLFYLDPDVQKAMQIAREVG